MILEARRVDVIDIVSLFRKSKLFLNGISLLLLCLNFYHLGLIFFKLVNMLQLLLWLLESGIVSLALVALLT